MVKMLELRCLENGDVVLVEAEQGAAEDEPLVRIQFSDEVRDMLGGDTLGVAEAMIEAATAYIGGEGDFADAELVDAELDLGSRNEHGDADPEDFDDAVSTAPVVLH